MTDANGEVISIRVDNDGRPFFYVSHRRAPFVREALDILGHRPNPSDAGNIVLTDDMAESDDGDEVVVFERGSDPDGIQDLLDELTWSGDRVVREIHP